MPEIANLVLKVFSEVAGLDDITLDDTLVGLGIDSLDALDAMYRLEESLKASGFGLKTDVFDIISKRKALIGDLTLLNISADIIAVSYRINVSEQHS